jgi:hypothetical protein
MRGDENMRDIDPLVLRSLDVIERSRAHIESLRRGLQKDLSMLASVAKRIEETARILAGTPGGGLSN